MTARRDDRTRALAPVAALGITAFFCCVDARHVTPTEPSPSPFVPFAPSAPTTDATGLSAPTANAGEPGTTTSAGLTAPPRLAAPPVARVRLVDATRRGPIRFSVDGRYRVIAGIHGPGASRESALAAGEDLPDVVCKPSARGLRLNTAQFPARDLTIIPEAGATFSIGGRSYRGTLVLRTGKDGRVVAENLLDLEQYVAGVLFAEMPKRFDDEALRSQAVAARTFALHRLQQGKTLRDDQGSQVYAGLERETKAGRRIVRSTRGEVLTYSGALIPAYFHSTCGGHTSSARDVFGMSAPPPLSHGVPCAGCRGTRWARWTRALDERRVAALYKGTFGDRLTPRSVVADNGGRPVVMEIIDRAGKPVDRPSADRLRNDYNLGRSLAQSLPSAWFSLQRGPKGLVAAGRGFGHGVGLCQYGSDGLARAGHDYRKILATYYPGADLTRRYD